MIAARAALLSETSPGSEIRGHAIFMTSPARHCLGYRPSGRGPGHYLAAGCRGAARRHIPPYEARLANRHQGRNASLSVAQ
jgi:hypothetical protein